MRPGLLFRRPSFLAVRMRAALCGKKSFIPSPSARNRPEIYFTALDHLDFFLNAERIATPARVIPAITPPIPAALPQPAALSEELWPFPEELFSVSELVPPPFKDPVGKIWELADPVVSPAYTAGLEGTPNELKLKYLADNDFAALSGEALRDAIKGEIKKKDGSLVGKMAAQGTTPRRLTDLIGSLCDLTSGSGDKGTPIVYIQGYFDNYTTE